MINRANAFLVATATGAMSVVASVQERVEAANVTVIMAALITIVAGMSAVYSKMKQTARDEHAADRADRAAEGEANRMETAKLVAHIGFLEVELAKKSEVVIGLRQRIEDILTTPTLPVATQLPAKMEVTVVPGDKPLA